MFEGIRGRGLFLVGLAALAAMVILPGPVQAANIGVHWSGYGANTSVITGTDGVVPNSSWNNVQTGWEMGLAGNMLDDTGTITTAAARLGTGVGGDDGAYSLFTTGSPEPLLNGGPGGFSPLAIQITGIPYASYEIIAYVNAYGTTAGSAWLGTKAGGSPTYYFTTTGTTTDSFVQSTSTSSSDHPAGNYVVFEGLSGSTQTLWIGNVASYPDGFGGNWGTSSAGFQIVETVPEPGTLGLLGAAAMLMIRRRSR